MHPQTNSFFFCRKLCICKYKAKSNTKARFTDSKVRLLGICSTPSLVMWVDKVNTLSTNLVPGPMAWEQSYISTGMNLHFHASLGYKVRV